MHARKALFILFFILILAAAQTAAGSAALAGLLFDPAWTADGDQKGSLFGQTVAPAGDVNGDGWDDLLVGAPRYALDLEKEGAAFLFYGGPTGLEAYPGWSAGGGLKGAEFGASVASAGDVNGDGFDDFIVGSPRYNSAVTTQSEEGGAFLFYGTDAYGGPSETPDWTFVGDIATAHVGSAVAGAGDLNRDGYDDVIVGADLYSNDAPSQGRVFVFLGSKSGLNPEPVWTFESHQSGARFGAAVGSAGDVNNDGYGDIFVGAPYYTEGDLDDSGAVFVFRGGKDGPSLDFPWTLTPDQVDTEFGISAASTGDVNGDGFDDLIVGAPKYNNGLYGSGAAFWYRGSGSGPVKTGWKAMIPDTGSLFGSVVAGAGDVNCDGMPDALVGAREYTGDHLEEGAFFVYYGGTYGLSSLYAWMAMGEKSDTDFGISAGPAGDVDADGCDDVAAGAPTYFIGTDPMGRAFLFLGSEGGPLGQTMTLHLPVIRR